MNNKTWLIFFSCFAAFQAIAEPTCQIDLNKDPYYRLELTASATFCKGKGNQNDPSCKDFPKEGAIQLHGLWPNYNEGYPTRPASVTRANVHPIALLIAITPRHPICMNPRIGKA